MLDQFGVVATILILGSCACSFLLARWLSKRRRNGRDAQARRAAEAAQSRQVRRARERQQKR